MPDDGSIEFKGPSRSYGWEAKTAIHLTKTLTLTVCDSCEECISSPHRSLARLTGSLRYRYGSHYRLTGNGPQVVASGFGVLGFSVTKRLRHKIEFDLSIDNLTNKQSATAGSTSALRLSESAGLLRLQTATGLESRMSSFSGPRDRFEVLLHN